MMREAWMRDVCWMLVPLLLCAPGIWVVARLLREALGSATDREAPTE